MKILLSGGGTAGSVSPLIAIYSQLVKNSPEISGLFVGTRSGRPEKEMLKGMQIGFTSIYSGKLRRYFDVRNFIDPFLILAGFVQSLFIVSKFDPDIVVGAGGFVSVPVIWAAWVLKKKIIIHQQDVRPSLSNILTMKLADAITVTFKESTRFFPKGKTHWIGNPSRVETIESDAHVGFTIDETKPLVVIMGGGTGSEYINTLVRHQFTLLTERYFIVHISGASKSDPSLHDKQYLQFGFLGDQLLALFKKATVVISRAGLSTLTELSYYSKPSIIIPLPHSHQAANAKYFFDRGAIEYHDQIIQPETHIIELLNQMVADPERQKKLAHAIHSIMKKNACSDMITLIHQLTDHGTTQSA